MSRYTAVLAISAVSSTACGAQMPLPQADRRPASVQLPELRLTYTSRTPESSPVTINAPLAVGTDGRVVLAQRVESPNAMTVTDSIGNVLRELGRRGEGPGELRAAAPVAIAGNRVTVFDLMQLRIVQLQLQGPLVSQAQLKKPVVPRAIVDSATGLGIVQGADGIAPALVSFATGDIRPLTEPGDTFMRAEFVGTPLAKSVGTGIPAVGVWAEGFIVANPATYHLGVYRWDGALVRVLQRNVRRPQPTAARVDEIMKGLAGNPRARQQTDADRARRREQLLAETLPYFGHTASLGFDEARRIWVIGKDADSAFADVYTPERLLGRRPIPCSGFDGSWAMKGSWLAMVCKPDDPNAELDAIVKLFHVIG